MGSTLHAFTFYSVEGDYSPQIYFENDEGYEITYGNWFYIHTIIEFGNFLLGTDIYLPSYNWLDDAESVKGKGMELVRPQEFVKICQAVIENITTLLDTENPLCDGEDWYLYDSNRKESFAEQKENILYYAEKLLTWAKKGLYFVSERD